MSVPANLPNSNSVTKTIATLSPGLKSLLSVEPSNLRAVSEIASNPGLLAEVTAALPAIKANASMPAGPEGVMKVISSKFVTYQQPVRNDAEWAQFWSDYYTVLEGLPLSALEAAMAACLADPKIEFLPKPAKIAELARLTPNRAVRAYDRAKAAVEWKPEPKHEKLSPEQIAELVKPLANKARVEPTAAEKERVKAQMREYIRQDDERKAALKAKSPAGTMPTTAGPVDDKGLTPSMRALMEGRG